MPGAGPLMIFPPQQQQQQPVKLAYFVAPQKTQYGPAPQPKRFYSQNNSYWGNEQIYMLDPDSLEAIMLNSMSQCGMVLWQSCL